MKNMEVVFDFLNYVWYHLVVAHMKLCFHLTILWVNSSLMKCIDWAVDGDDGSLVHPTEPSAQSVALTP